MELTRLEKFAKRYFGYKYLVNLRSKQIHCLDNTHYMCHLTTISRKNVTLAKYSKVKRLLSIGYKQCNYCFKRK